MLCRNSIAFAASRAAIHHAVSRGMEKPKKYEETQRVTRLRKIVEEMGGQKAFWDKYNLPGESNFLSQVLNCTRPLGEKAARKIEKNCGWPAGFLDGSDAAGNDEVFQMLQAFPPAMRLSLEEHIRTLYRELKGHS